MNALSTRRGLYEPRRISIELVFLGMVVRTQTTLPLMTFLAYRLYGVNLGP